MLDNGLKLCYNKDTKKEKETKQMTNLDSYSVYDNRTNKMIACGTFQEIEDYLENPGRYTVVWNYTGNVVSG